MNFSFLTKKSLTITSRVLAVILLLSACIVKPTPANAQNADFEITSSYEIEYQPGNDFVTVKEHRRVKVNSATYYYPVDGQQTFFLPDLNNQSNVAEREFKKSSLNITNTINQKKTFTVTESDGGIEIEVPNNQEINNRSAYELTLTYQTHELVNKSGNVTNLYVPGISKDIQFEKLHPTFKTLTRYSFNTTVIVPTSAPKASYIEPTNITETVDGDSRRYVFTQESLIDNTGWIQLGEDQFYYFKLVQRSPKTDNITPEKLTEISNIMSTNIFRIALPREYEETNQKTFIKSFNPQPKRLERDEEGNLFGVFEVPANKESEIIIEGYISLHKDAIDFQNHSEEKVPDLEISQYKALVNEKTELQKYLTTDKYWQIENEVIQTAATELLTGQTTLLGLVRNDYSYIVNKLDYSYEKVNSDNPRLGAVAALTGSQAVCMEYADALTGILRAQGVPTRAAFGYGNDPTGAENKIGETEATAQNIGHQWVQVWVPDYGWMSVDPTWGESDRTYIGGDLDHILWYTAAGTDQSVSDTLVYSADPLRDTNLKNFDLYLQALPQGEFEKITNLASAQDLLGQFNGKEDNSLVFFFKTTMLGRALVIFAPVCLSFLVLVTILSFITSTFRKNKREKV